MSVYENCLRNLAYAKVKENLSEVNIGVESVDNGLKIKVCGSYGGITNAIAVIINDILEDERFDLDTVLEDIRLNSKVITELGGISALGERVNE